MKRINTFDITIQGHKEYEDNIIKTYPKQYVSLFVKKKSNGYEDVFVDSIYGILGELYSNDGYQLIPFLKDTTKYHIEAFIKKIYPKDRIYEAIILIVNVYEKDINFIAPQYKFLGNYISNYDKYDFGYMMTDDDEIKCSISKPNQEVVDDIDDYDNAKLVINGDIVDIYHFSELVGNLSKKVSEKIISYLQDENRDVKALFRISESRTTYEKRARLEVEIKEKKYLEHSKYLENKSLLIDGVQVVRKVRKDNMIYFHPVEDKDLNNPNLENDIAQKENDFKDKSPNNGSVAGCIVIIIGFILLFCLFKCL